MSDETNTYGDDIHLTTTDATTIYNTLIAALEKGAGEPLYPGDERRIFGEGLVAVFVALYNSLDDTGRQTLLRYARGEVLDAIGERLDVHRLEGSPAKTTMRFSVSTPQPNNIIIPKWTKVTPDSDHYFATDEIAVLQAGAYSVEIPTSAVSNGTEYNGYAPGTITTLVDLIPYIESVTNITATAGGDDGEPYTEEGDNRLRERIRLAPASRSTAGPEQAYIYWAMTADSSIIDARAVSETETISRTLTVYDGHAFIGGGRLLPDTLIVKEHGESTAGVEDTDYTVDYTDDLLTIELKGALTDATSLDITTTRTLEGCVKIVPLLEGGAVPDESILEKVLEACNASDIRPLTDVVTAVAPEVITYDIEIVYYTTPETEAEVVANVEGTGEVREWYQYGGKPYHFKVLSDNPGLVNENLDLFLSLLRTVKRRSAWLDAILICLTGEMFLYAGMAVREHGEERHVMGTDEIHLYHGAVVHDNNRETVTIGTSVLASD